MQSQDWGPGLWPPHQGVCAPGCNRCGFVSSREGCHPLSGSVCQSAAYPVGSQMGQHAEPCWGREEKKEGRRVARGTQDAEQWSAAKILQCSLSSKAGLQPSEYSR